MKCLLRGFRVSSGSKASASTSPVPAWALFTLLAPPRTISLHSGAFLRLAAPLMSTRTFCPPRARIVNEQAARLPGRRSASFRAAINAKAYTTSSTLECDIYSYMSTPETRMIAARCRVAWCCRYSCRECRRRWRSAFLAAGHLSTAQVSLRRWFLSNSSSCCRSGPRCAIAQIQRGNDTRSVNIATGQFWCVGPCETFA